MEEYSDMSDPFTDHRIFDSELSIADRFEDAIMRPQNEETPVLRCEVCRREVGLCEGTGLVLHRAKKTLYYHKKCWRTE